MVTVNLSKFKDEDIMIFKDWLYRPHVATWYEHPLDWIDEIEKRNNEFRWIKHFIVKVDEIPIGFCQYYEYCNSGETWHGDVKVDGAYSIDYMIGESDYLNKGYGRAIVNELVKKIKDVPNANRVIVQPEVENIPSCNTLLSAGFEFDRTSKIYIMEV